MLRFVCTTSFFRFQEPVYVVEVKFADGPMSFRLLPSSTILQPLLHVFLNPSPPVAAKLPYCALPCFASSPAVVCPPPVVIPSLFVLMSFVFCLSLAMFFVVPYPNLPLTAFPPIFFLRTGTFFCCQANHSPINYPCTIFCFVYSSCFVKSCC